MSPTPKAVWTHGIFQPSDWIKLRACGLDGRGVRIGVIDTGLIADHPELAGKLVAWAEFGALGKK